MKQKTCKVCKTKFEPRYNTTQAVCSMTCAVEQVNKQKDKQAEKDRKARRAETRKAKERLKSRSDWLREAQIEFNKYIRERDRGQNCISCGKPARKENAGHFKTTKAYPELRFHPFNCHLQCEHCNTYLSGNLLEFRKRLVAKVGGNVVDWLEGPHKAQNLSIEDIKEIKAYYKEQLKLLKQANKRTLIEDR